nr:unnamed protein product [Callosobruchus analis]
MFSNTDHNQTKHHYLVCDGNSSTKTLGVSWSPREDKLQFQLKSYGKFSCHGMNKFLLNYRENELTLKISSLNYMTSTFQGMLRKHQSFHVSCMDLLTLANLLMGLASIYDLLTILLVHLYEKVINSITLKIDSEYFWTDSTIVLSWINTEPKILKTFVSNRLTDIQSIQSLTTGIMLTARIIQRI